jgi:hypothetical protein
MVVAGPATEVADEVANALRRGSADRLAGVTAEP